MIYYLKHNEIDFIKYDHCISSSHNSLIYGFSWYLNCVSPNWHALILDNYKAVMPLTIRKKYGINYIFHPAWVQQLGIFSAKKIDNEMLMQFVSSIPKKYKKIHILFNYKNQLLNEHITLKVNYILNLTEPYESLFKKYNTLRKRSIKKARNLGLIIEQIDEVNTIIQLFKENKGQELQLSEGDYSSLIKIVNSGLVERKVELYIVRNKEFKLISGIVLLRNTNRIVYLFSAVNIEGRESQANSFLIDFLIHKYCNRKYLFDFEGSMVPNIAKYFKSFGAEAENYYFFSKKRFL